MQPKLKQKWIEALRSGKYVQTHSHLNNPDGYCCLGVLCDIIIKDKLNTRLRYDEAVNEFKGHDIVFLDYDGYPLRESMLLPRQLRAALDITDDQHSELLVLNDGRLKRNTTYLTKPLQFEKEPKSFAEIADYIEKEM